VLAHYTDGEQRNWDCGAKWYVRVDKNFSLFALPWTPPGEHFVTSPSKDPDGINATQPLVRGGFFFFATATLLIDGINVWDPVHGTRPFIRWPGDYTRGAADLGTDGVDMVWTQGEDKKPNDKVYPTRSAMTAPFTGDPAAVKPRRLRSSPFLGVGNFAWEVGCGYAMHEAENNQLMVGGSRMATHGYYPTSRCSSVSTSRSGSPASTPIPSARLAAKFAWPASRSTPSAPVRRRIDD